MTHNYYRGFFLLYSFSFDLRNRSVAPRLKLEAPPRALFDVSATPTAVLSLFGITREDVGIFSCRVDFKKSPTRYWNLNVTVIGKSV